MKSLKVLISLALSLAIILSVGTVFAATDLGGGYFGYKLNGGTLTSVNDGTLSVIQPAEDVYYYINNNNILLNSSFEESDTATNTSGKEWLQAPIVDGWITSYSKSADFNYSISDDSHSGKNSLKLALSAGTGDTRIFSNSNGIITDNNLKGRLTGLSTTETYIVSYWVKGTGYSQIFWKQLNSEATDGSNVRDGVKQYDEWTLVTDEVTSYVVGNDGQAWWNINAKQTDGVATEIYIDDVSMQTKSGAVANVVAMIENLDITLSTAERAIDDIEQWVAVLGSENISNYVDFEKKVEDYSKYAVYGYVNTNGVAPNNASFEASNEASVIHSRKDAYVEVTDGWMTNWTMNSTEKPFQNASISNDAHSGKNSLNIRITSNDNNAYNLAIHNADNYAGLIPYTSYGLPNQKYIVSLWVKGDSVRGRSTKYTEATDGSSNGTWAVGDWAPVSGTVGDAWKLYTFQITTNSLGQAGWYIYAQHTANTTIETYIDDIHVATNEQYIANVETMIDNLNTSAPYAARAIDDIEQWIAVLGSENISNYDLFLMKKSGYVYYSDASTLDNTGFEASDSAEIVKNNTGTFKEITTGWVANYTTATMQTAEISNDAHSGNNALKISVTNNDTEAGKNVYYNLPIYSSNISDSGTPYYQFDNANTKYIVSAWIKGAKLRGGIRLYDEETATWQTATTWQTTMENDAGDKWTLYTFNVTTNSLGQAQWFINVPQIIDSTATVIIDDVQVLTLKENIALVDSLIDQLATFDKSSDEYARAKADIEAWLPVLDSADLNLKYDIVLNEKTNIITPNEGYTHLAQGDYIASVTLKGNGEVNRVYGDNITNIYSITTELIDEYVTHRERVTVGAYGTHYMGVQITNSAAINTVDIKDFSLKRVGDVNESGEIDIRDMVCMAKGLNGTDATVDELVADYDNSASFDKDDIIAIRNLVLEKDPIS